MDVLSFPEAARRELLKRCPDTPPTQEPISDSFSATYQVRPHGVPVLPSHIVLRDYQREAVNNWIANKGRGILKMATGSGKTITALSIAAELYTKIDLEALIVICPFRHLVKQWANESQKYGLKAILAFENVDRWDKDLTNQLVNLSLGLQDFISVITTNTTLMSTVFQAKLESFPKKTLLIGDEVHNLGAKKLSANLPRRIGLRLGLSATPERYLDEQGTQAIFNYFGSIIPPEFTLRDAIERGALVHYLYYPMLVENESERYAELSARIGRAIAAGGEGENNEALTVLLAQRARLVGAAENKLSTLKQIMADRLDTSHTLFYCGDGSIEGEIDQESQKQLEAITKILGIELHYRVNMYIANTSMSEREELHRRFSSGDLQGLVAIRCLDEGVDIPAIQTAVILASSSNPRQFIQRRGRILRRSPGKERAILYDMVVVPPDLGREALETERSLMRKELLRFAEFADLADNCGEARSKIKPLQKRFDLLDL